MAEKDKYGKIHDKEVAALLREIDGLYSDLADTVGFIGVTSASSVDKNVPFSLSDYPAIKARIDKALAKLAKKLGIAIVNGVRSQWTLANKKNDELCRVVFGALINSITDAQRRQYFNNNQKALEAFLKRKDSGLLLSQKVWNYVNEGRLEIESTLELGIKTGQSAAEMARDLKQYLKFPDKLFRRVRDEEGNLHLSKAAKDFHPGQGVYRSSYKNARRLAATETNMAYRSADHARHMQLDFIVGIRINLSNNHTCLDRNGKPQPFYDICDELRGDYPKWFDFKGWHPLCYDDKSEVYTEKGWKLFADVCEDDKILTLNPDTFDLEYSRFIAGIRSEYRGDMIHFFNRAYSQLVTPDHEILCLKKNKEYKEFTRVPASRCGKTQPIYRSCEWRGEKVESVMVNNISVNYDEFAQFMGYWLSDGSLGHKYEIGIAQQDENRENIFSCIERMGFKPRYNFGKVEFNSRDWYEYLQQFGKCNEKFIPNEIKSATREQIKTFLDAFISCDGHIKSPHAFVGNHGNVCYPTREERIYYTTSRRMADDLGELILKSGKRPSFRLNKIKGKVQKFKNGTYRINHDCWIISECHSTTATQYNKEIIDYEGFVYDLVLEKNATMYIRREGKCFWGSNCRCFVTTILKTDEEVDRDSDGVDRGSVNEVKEMPPQWRAWLERNHDRIDRAEARGTLPYFLRDNEEAWRGGFDSRKEYDNYDEDKWEKVLYDKESGGYLVVDRKRAESGSVNKQEKSKFEKELNMAMVYARNGYKIQMLEEVPRISSPDVLINGVPADLKKIISENNIVKYAKKAIQKQGAEIVLFQLDEMTPVIRFELNKLKLLGLRYKYFITGEDKVYTG